MTMRILLDEHIDRDFMHVLRLPPYSFDVTCVGLADAPPRGTHDAVLLAWCEENDAILITMDRRTIPSLLKAHLSSGRHLPGILFVSSGAGWRELADDILVTLECLDAWELRDTYVFLPI
jgi:hypothetical protein